ncbi:MAG: L-histidine N(alpha)-methyltransferase [Terriglobia bacterium]
MLTHPAATLSLTQFAADVRAGLSGPGEKALPSKYFYDEIGSALFEAISVLPEYGLTRADERLLRRHAGAVARRIAAPAFVAEMGSGTGRKTRWVLEALAARQQTVYYPIEISPFALATCERELSDLDSVTVIPLEREYLVGLAEVVALRPAGHSLLVLFLGSTIGNFAQAESLNFLRRVRGEMRARDALLLGTDLQRSEECLLPAYNDPIGVTAAFNLNLLARINRELGGAFNLGLFEHHAQFNEETQSIEIYLRSRCDQKVAIGKTGPSVDFAQDEMILTENSHKYSTEEVRALAENSGFRCAEQWIDGEWPFAESLLVAE